MTESIPAHSAILATLWKKVLSRFRRRGPARRVFARLRARAQSGLYAGALYGQMQKLMPGDEVTERRVREVQALATTDGARGRQSPAGQTQLSSAVAHSADHRDRDHHRGHAGPGVSKPRRRRRRPSCSSPPRCTFTSARGRHSPSERLNWHHFAARVRGKSFAPVGPRA